MGLPSGFIARSDSSSSSNETPSKDLRYDSTSFTLSTPVRLDVNEETGSLVINFGANGEKAEVLEADALVLVTFLDRELADIEVLFDNKDVVKKLKESLERDKNKCLSLICFI